MKIEVPREGEPHHCQLCWWRFLMTMWPTPGLRVRI
jgi:hypothetical protein